MTPELYRRLMYWGKLVGMIGVTAGAIVSAAAAWPLIEPYLAAHRGYVRYVAGEVSNGASTAQSESRKVIRDLQVEQAEGKRDAAAGDLVKWEIELGKTSNDQTRALIEKQMRELTVTKHRLDSQIETLNKARDQ